MITIPFKIHRLLPFNLVMDLVMGLVMGFLTRQQSRCLASGRHIRLPRVLLALLLGVFPHLFSVASADTVLLYDFEDLNGDFDLSADVIANGIEAGSWSVVSSTIRDFSGNPGRAMASSGFSVSNAFIVPITVAEGNVLQLNTVVFDQSASSSGPVDWEIKVADVSVASGTTTGSFETTSTGLTLDGLTGSFLIEISAVGASSNRGTFRIDNFIVDGNIQPVPVPGAVILLVSGCLGLLSAGRRRHSSSHAVRH